MMQATVVWNPKYGKYDGIHAGKVVSRCSTVPKVREYFLVRGFAESNIMVVPFVTKPAQTILPKAVFATNDQVRDRLRMEVAMVVDHAKRLYGNKISLNPAVRFFNRGSAGGRAHYRDMSVSFNEVLAKENPVEFNNTVIHEVAHLVVKQIYPLAKPHGKEFKHVMISLGGNGKRTHSYDVSSVKQQRSYTYHVIKCGCKEHLVSKARAFRAASLKCKKCGTRCEYTGKTVTRTN